MRIEECDMRVLSQYIPIKYVMENNHLFQNRGYLSKNTTLTMNVVKNLHLPNAEGHWDWEWICEYINIQEVINHPGEPWDREYLSHNRTLTVDMINIDMPNSRGEWRFDRAVLNSKKFIEEYKHRISRPMTIKMNYLDICIFHI